ncbi:MAG: prepilin-type N-terminal cleavage/methylation domain-containing protein [Synergistetes bacterium]|nr:prepilin-type N-terminal cleavage/methylation domain-containing protein [Synergistota bacterium]
MKKAFTLVELLVAVSIIVVVLLSLFGVFHGTVVGYLSVKENSELNRMLIAFDLDLNASITGLIPSLPADYTYLYIPPDRGDGLLLFVVTSYSCKGLGVVERTYWIKGSKVYSQVDVPVDGKPNGFNKNKAHILITDIESVRLYLQDKGRIIYSGIYKEYEALPQYLVLELRVKASEIEQNLRDKIRLKL